MILFGDQCIGDTLKVRTYFTGSICRSRFTPIAWEIFFPEARLLIKTIQPVFGKNAMIAIFTYHNDSIWARGFKNTESQGIAYSLDEGITWKKYSGNPVLNNSGEQDFRDPKVFWNDEINSWNMVLAVGDKLKFSHRRI